MKIEIRTNCIWSSSELEIGKTALAELSLILDSVGVVSANSNTRTGWDIVFSSLEDLYWTEYFARNNMIFDNFVTDKMQNLERNFARKWSPVTIISFCDRILPTLTKNIQWQPLISHSFDRLLLKIWQSAWPFLNISPVFQSFVGRIFQPSR